MNPMVRIEYIEIEGKKEYEELIDKVIRQCFRRRKITRYKPIYFSYPNKSTNNPKIEPTIS